MTLKIFTWYDHNYSKCKNTLDPIYKEFGYYEHPAKMNKFYSEKRTLLISSILKNIGCGEYHLKCEQFVREVVKLLIVART